MSVVLCYSVIETFDDQAPELFGGVYLDHEPDVGETIQLYWLDNKPAHKIIVTSANHDLMEITGKALPRVADVTADQPTGIVPRQASDGRPGVTHGAPGLSDHEGKQSMTELQIVTAEVAALNTEPACLQHMLELRQHLEFFIGRAKEIKAALDDATIAWIKTNGDIDLGGGQRWYVATPPKVKVRDMKAGIEILLDVVDGDFGRFAECLSSSAMKHGAIRKVMQEKGKPELYEQVFETTREPELVEGKSTLKLCKSDERFSR